MKKVLCFLLSVWAVCAVAETKLTIIRLQGEAQQYAIAQLGKITFKNDVMYLYGKQGNLLGYTDIDKVGKIVFDGVTALEQQDSDGSLRICSNPAQGLLVVKNLQGKQTVRVFSMTGQLVTQAPSMDGEVRIDVSGLGNGTYLLQAGAQVVKFVK
jgi:hypothetical protein